MHGFVTNSGTKYYVNSSTNEFVGGKYKKPVRFSTYTVEFGRNAVFYCSDRVITLGVVRAYF